MMEMLDTAVWCQDKVRVAHYGDAALLCEKCAVGTDAYKVYLASGPMDVW